MQHSQALGHVVSQKMILMRFTTHVLNNSQSGVNTNSRAKIYVTDGPLQSVATCQMSNLCAYYF